MIEAAELQMPEKCLTTVIDTTGVYYRVPIACINDPDNYGVNKQMDEMKQKVAPDQKQLNVSTTVATCSFKFRSKSVTPPRAIRPSKPRT
jgi:hypothetical protein